MPALVKHDRQRKLEDERKRDTSAAGSATYTAITPTVHAVPGEAFGPLLLTDERVAVEVAGARERLRATFRLDGFLGHAFEVAVLDFVQDSVPVEVHGAEFPLVD